MIQPVRVLWLIKGLGPGGAETLLLTHARLRDRNRFAYRVAYLVPRKDHLVAALADEGIEARCLRGEQWWDPRWIPRLRRMMSSADIVHSHSPLPAGVARLVSRTIRRSHRPSLVYTEHNEWGKHRRATRWLNSATLGLEASVVAVSAGVKRSMRTRREVDIVHHWIDAEMVRVHADRDGVRAELGFGSSDVVVGTVANLRWEKGYDLLLDAAGDVIRARPDITFVAVGQGPLEDELRARHEELGLGERFRFLGYREDAIRVMSGFDMFCLPSRHEGLPVALMEAMALGLPVVATDVGGVADATSGTGAQIIPAGSSEYLAAALRRVGPARSAPQTPSRRVTWPSEYEDRYRRAWDRG